jgi:hypothetical protein
MQSGRCSIEHRPPWPSLGAGLCGGLRLDRANNQLGIRRTRDEIERHAIALAVAVGPRGTDFELGAFLAAFLLDNRVNAMRRAVAVGFGRHDQFFRY